MTPSRKLKAGCGLLAFTALGALSWLVFLGVRELTSREQGSDAVIEGWKAVREERYADAVRHYTEALGQKLDPPARAYAYGNRGWSLANLHRDAEAIRDFNAALQISPNLVFALLDRGLAYHRLGNTDAALADYNRTIALDPNATDAYQNRALIFGEDGLFQKAIADMSEAIRCAPQDPRWLIRRGFFYLAANQPDEAIASLEAALRLAPESIDGNYDLARAYRAKGEPRRGLDEIANALRAHPRSEALHLARGLVYFDRWELEKALIDFDAAIVLNPKSSPAYAYRGQIALSLSGADAAIGYETRALSLDPKLPQAHFALAVAYCAAGRYSEALAQDDLALQERRLYIDAIVHRALTEGYLGDYQTSRRDLAAAAKKFRGVWWTHRCLAWFLASCPRAEFRDGGMAVQEANIACTLSRDRPESLDALAMSYAETGDFTRAAAIEKKVVAEIPSFAASRAQAKRLKLYQQHKPYREIP